MDHPTSMRTTVPVSLRQATRIPLVKSELPDRLRRHWPREARFVGVENGSLQHPSARRAGSDKFANGIGSFALPPPPSITAPLAPVLWWALHSTTFAIMRRRSASISAMSNRRHIGRSTASKTNPAADCARSPTRLNRLTMHST